MADSLKVLGQVDPAATTTTVLYTVPDKTQTTVSSIVAANRTGSAITFRLSVHVGGAGADDKQFLFYDKSVYLNLILLTRNQGNIFFVFVFFFLFLPQLLYV